ncbi:MAG: C39 family peptidase [Planctomycetota bacterium]
MSAARRHARAVLILLLVSCATSPPAATPATVIEGVPFYAQEAHQCGPASLAGVLNFWGAGVTPEEIGNEIYSPTAKGTLDIDLVIYARKRGFDARHFSGSVEDVRAGIDSGHPLVVFVDLGRWTYRRGHFMVVVGYTGDGFIVNSGRKERKYVPLDTFIKSWEKTGFWTLLVRPA